MKQVANIYFPKSDGHWSEYMVSRGYQRTMFKHALELTEGLDCFVDVGAHVGLITAHAVKAGFKHIVAFEACPFNFECFKKNHRDIKAHNVIIGTKGRAKLVSPSSLNSGSIQIKVQDEGPRDIYSLDEFELAPNLLKIDVEGFEAEVVRGGEETIKLHHPTVIVEQRRDSEAYDLLVSWGYELKTVVNKDYILVWE